LLAVAAAVLLAARSTPRPRRQEGDIPVAVAVLCGAAAVALLGHRILSEEWGLGAEYGRLAVAIVAALACILAVLVLRSWGGRPPAVGAAAARSVASEPPPGDGVRAGHREPDPD
jgi:hypothetical protein